MKYCTRSSVCLKQLSSISCKSQRSEKSRSIRVCTPFTKAIPKKNERTAAKKALHGHVWSLEQIKLR